MLQDNPDLVFGESGMFNTREGYEHGRDVEMHNDEPIAMGQTTMDSSSDESESDGEETEQDKQKYKEAIERAEKL